MLLSTMVSPLKRLIEKPTETVIHPGDFVRYWDADAGEERIGIYVDLWYYISNETESSPFPMNDEFCEWTQGRDGYRPMWHAFIQAGTDNNPRTTYANVDSIEKVSEIDWLRFHFQTNEVA